MSLLGILKAKTGRCSPISINTMNEGVIAIPSDCEYQSLSSPEQDAATIRISRDGFFVNGKKLFDEDGMMTCETISSVRDFSPVDIQPMQAYKPREIITNCNNCGAVLHNNKCKYCGSEY